MVQDRVKLWMEYTWEHQKIFNENEVLSFLPPKMRTDLALKVHYATLSKVKLFQDCDTGLLKELVTKLRPMIFLPGDYICRKGDIGREMYIVKSGYVMVMTPNSHKNCNNRIIMATLGEGSVFGEIALLGISGMSRRTADVVSKGFSNLFILRKDDLEEALKHFPDAKRILNAKARKIMKENDEREAKDEGRQKKTADGDIFSQAPKKDPAILEAVMALRKRQKTQRSRNSSVSVSHLGGPVSDVSSHMFTDTDSDMAATSVTHCHTGHGGLRADHGHLDTGSLTGSRLAPLSRRTSLASTSIGYMTDTMDNSDSVLVTESEEQETDINQVP